MSLVVPVRNEEAHIAACLEAIREQTYPADLLEVIVMDGESSDRTATVVANVAAVDRRIKLVPNPERTMSAGLNLGIRLASGDYVGAVSGHSVLSRDYVARVVQAALETGAWSVGGTIVRTAGSPMQRAIALATSSRVGVGDSLHNFATKSGWAETVFPGFWRRELFDQIGMFDPTMIANEDNELSLRIREAGGRIWYDPEIRVEYVPRATLGGLFRQYRMYGLGKMRVLGKHRGGLRWRHVVPAAWVAFLIVGGGLSLAFGFTAPFWLAGLATYTTTVVVAALRLHRGSAGWWRIAAAFATLHVAYGLGTWQGLITWPSNVRRG